MSDLTLFNASQVPDFARNNELSETALALTGGGTGGSSKRISIKGGVFRLVSGGKEIAAIDDRHLDVIIVKAAPKVSRIFTLVHTTRMPLLLRLTAGLTMARSLMPVQETNKRRHACRAHRTKPVRVRVIAVLAVISSVWLWCWRTIPAVTLCS